ncbi:hypothetical protein LCGC14_2094000 [marine sediment metagenome]|uniref:Uncharacterized protein n=1 Tax=marine sediment metagenome TaxID=412755 RepID=A0A0F9EBU2_9ZZZZ
MTTAEKLLALATETPNLTQTNAGLIVGVSRERVRQLTDELGLPFGSDARKRRVLALHDSGFHHTVIAIQEGVTLNRIATIIRLAGRKRHPLFQPCDWCGETFEVVQINRQRWCSPRCQMNGNYHNFVVKTRGNLPCIRCRTKRAIAPKNPCPGHQRHLFNPRDSLIHCRRGHEWTPSNTYRYGKQRQCRACNNQRYHARKVREAIPA